MESQDDKNFDDISAALESINEAKRETAKISKAPPGYYSMLGLAVALLTIAGVQKNSMSLAFIAIACALIAVTVTMYSTKVPTWGYGKIFDRSAWPFWVMTLFAVVSIGGASFTSSKSFAYISALLTLIAWSILGPMYDQAYRKQLEGEDS